MTNKENTDKKQLLHPSLPKDLYIKLKKDADNERRSVNDQLIIILEKYYSDKN